MIGRLKRLDPSRKRASTSQSRRGRSQLSIEPLEARTLLTVLAVDDAGVAFTIDQGQTLVSNGTAADVTFVANGPAGAVWNYLDDGSNQDGSQSAGDSNWFASLGFDDSLWQSGPAIIGYGDPDIDTVVGFGGDENQKFPTTYFRHEFNLSASDLLGISSLTVNFQYDDGVAIYLNGREIARENLAAGAIFSDFVTTFVAGGNETAITSVVVTDPAVLGSLVAGQNVLTAEIHQASGASSDIRFDLELINNASGQGPILANDDLSAASGTVVVTKLNDPIDSVSGQNAGIVNLAADGTFTFTPNAGYFGTATFGYQLADADNSSDATVTLSVNPIVTPSVAVDDLYSLNDGETLVVNAISDGQLGVVIPTQSAWDYLDAIKNAEDPGGPLNYPTDNSGRAWNDPAFVLAQSADNSDALNPVALAWNKNGAGIFGAGGLRGFATDTTLAGIDQAPDGFSNDVTTYLFRRTFSADPSGTQLSARLLSDDGAVIYVNGQEVYRHLMAGNLGDALSTTDLANSVGNEDAYVDITFDVTGLLNDDGGGTGVNTIAVEVHQVSTTSSDVGFDLELSAIGQSSGLLANDSNADGDPFSVIAVGGQALVGGTITVDTLGGSATIDDLGALSYTPELDFIGIDSLVYTITGGATATVTLNVLSDQDTPVAADDSYSVDQGSQLLVGVPLPADLDFAQGESLPLVPLGSPQWRYLDDGSDQGTLWRDPSFDPNDPAGDGSVAAWATGAAQLGYGDGDESTTIGFVDIDPLIPEDQKNATTYFLKSFPTPAGVDPSGLDELILWLQRDDGAVVYLNGTEIARSNLTPNPAFDKYAHSTAANDGNTVRTYRSIDPNLLTTDGSDNVIAIEIHQANPFSSDITMDAELLIPQAAMGVLANDTDADENILTATVDTPPSQAASFTLNGDGTFSYQPLPAFFGTDSFTYTVNDGDGNTSLGTVTIEVAQSPFRVISSTPVGGAILASAPSGVVVDFNEAVLAGSLNAGDLQVDGTPAIGLSVVDSDTVLFNLPALPAGPHQITIVEGAILSGEAGNPPVRAFSSQFTVTSAAVVETLAPQNLSLTGATLRVNVTDIGFDNPDLTIYWGNEDGGTNPANWDTTIDIGSVGLGTAANHVATLLPGTTYFYRGLASNTAGTAWTPTAASFTTPAANLLPRINELMADNVAALADQDGSFSDWIEIYNPDVVSQDLSGWYLTDDPLNLTQWQFPATTIAASEYLLVFASGKDGITVGPELHTNFKLGAGGEYLALVQPDGVTIVQEFAPEFPSLAADESYGLRTDNQTFDKFFPSTPGAANLSGEIVINEVMYHPASEDVAEEYIELTNVGGLPVNMLGWQFTKGVDYTFGNVTIGPGEMLVVAANTAAFSVMYPSVTNVVGGWTGRLSNRSETIELSTDLGLRVDRVEYADQGDWATRRAGPDDRGSTGWDWVAGHDGLGKSLELINARLTNFKGQNWTSSTTDEGTPGAANSVAQTDIAPMILDLKHGPAIPNSSEPVTITAELIDEVSFGLAAAVHYRVSTSNPGPFIELTMFDDGLNGDGATGDGVYGTQIPAQADGSVVEFYVSASDVNGNTRTYPAATDDSGGQEANALYQVDDSAGGALQPVYRIIMTEAERNEFENINRQSNAEMNATFISSDGSGTKVRYNAGVRIRGAGSRSRTPPNYRVNLARDLSWNGVTALNLNTQYTHSQIAAAAVFAASLVPSADATAVQVRVNGQDLANDGLPQYGSYVYLEVVNGDFANAHFPDDSAGNLYKGLRPNSGLRYLGTDPDPYRATYDKRTNASEDDWSDLIELTDVLNNAPDDTYIADLNQVVNVGQWLEYFAIYALLADNETTLATGAPDDYLLYRGVTDPRFILMPRDLDTLLGEGDNPGGVNDSIFRATGQPAISRFLTHPEITNRYYRTLLRLANTTFSAETINPLLDNALGGYVPQATIDNMKQFAADRRSFVLSQIPTSFSASSGLAVVDGFPQTDEVVTGAVSGDYNPLTTDRIVAGGVEATLSPIDGTWSLTSVGGGQVIVPQRSVWKYLDDGNNQATAWRDVAFDDSTWASGTAELGYGDGDETTVVSFVTTDGQKNATTYFRNTFTVDDPSQFVSLNIGLKRDDGAAVYLNGVEVVRDRLNADAPFDEYAIGGPVGGGNEDTFFPFSAAASLLVAGTNVLAVEIHQANGFSSDISFDLQLSGNLPGTSDDIPLTPGINRVVVQAFDSGNTEIDRTFVDIWYDDTSTSTLPGGTLATNTTLLAADGPFVVTGDIVVPAGVTLTIEKGTTLFFQPDAGITVSGGRLLAEGTASQRIRMTRVPGTAGGWEGIALTDSLTDNRMTYLDMEYGDGQGESIRVVRSQLLVDQMTWANINNTILEVLNPSLEVRNSYFPNVNAEYIHGTNITGNEYLIIDGNVFAESTSGDDVIDFLGAARPGPVLQILNNIFLGGGDDGIDLDGTDAHVEGNLFANFRLNTSRTTTSNAIATGRPQTGPANDTEVTVVRNIFFNNDHAILLKENAFLTAQNNVFVGMTEAAIQFTEIGGTAVSGPGKGALLDGNLFYNNAQLFKNLIDDGSFLTDLTMNRSIVPSEVVDFGGTAVNAADLGTGNLTDDPRLIDPAASSSLVAAHCINVCITPAAPNPVPIPYPNISLSAGSPALAAGPNGLDIGFDVAGGASISGEPSAVTPSASATLTVAGPGITDYRFRLNGGIFSPQLPISTPIQLSGLADGTYTAAVIGKNSAGLWQDMAAPTVSSTWTVDSSLVQLQISEVLAINDAAVGHQGTFPDMIELTNGGAAAAVDLSGMSLSDDPLTPGKYIFPAGTTLAAGERLVLYANDPDGTTGIHLGFSLRGTGESVHLFDTAAGGNALIDEVFFGMQASDLSIGRLSDGTWALNQPTFGAENIAQPTGDPTRLRINELLTDDGPLFNDDFIELYNADPLPVSLAGLFLSDLPSAQPAKHPIAPLSFIAGGGWGLFVADDQESQGPEHVGFNLDRQHGQIGLFGSEADPIDFVLYGPQYPDISQGRNGDGDPLFTFLSPPNLGMSNSTSGSNIADLLANLRVTEIMYNPTGGATFEYIELQNAGSQALDLDGVRLENGIGFTFPAITLSADEYVVVASDPAAFATRYGAGVNVAGAYSGNLSNGGENLELVLPYPFSGKIQDFTYDDIWYPTTDGGGRSLIPIDPTGDPALLSQPSGWRVSHDTDGSPGEADFILGDLNRDNRVGMIDLGRMQSNFGTTAGMTTASGDLNRDAAVTRADVSRLLSGFGRVYTPPVPSPPAAASSLIAEQQNLQAVDAVLAARTSRGTSRELSPSRRIESPRSQVRVRRDAVTNQVTDRVIDELSQQATGRNHLRVLRASRGRIAAHPE